LGKKERRRAKKSTIVTIPAMPPAPMVLSDIIPQPQHPILPVDVFHVEASIPDCDGESITSDDSDSSEQFDCTANEADIEESATSEGESERRGGASGSGQPGTSETWVAVSNGLPAPGPAP